MRITWPAVLLCLTACATQVVRTNRPPSATGAAAARASFDHALWDRICRARVSPEGIVDYPALAGDHELLDVYLDMLAKVDPALLPGRNEQLAYWINAYDAITVRGILLARPPGRVPADLRTTLLTNCGGRDVTLAGIEAILARFDDPRVWVALCDGTTGGPPLQDSAYAAARLDAQLDRTARRFLADATRNRFDDKTAVAHLARVFEAHAAAFAAPPWGSLRGFMRRHAKPRPWLATDFPIDFLDLDATLNGPSPAPLPRRAAPRS